MQLPWILGPQWLCDTKKIQSNTLSCFPLIEPDCDVEVRPLSTNVSVKLESNGLGTERFERFSSWNSLIRAVMRLQRLVNMYKTRTNSQLDNWSHSDAVQKAELLVLKELQQERFLKDIKLLSEKKQLSKDSRIAHLAPFLLRVGGRINGAVNQLPAKEINPIVLPKGSHITTLILRNFHEKTKHQGRLFTEGAVRSGGYWAIGAKRMISSLIHNCVTCRRLRRSREIQKMADIPPERLTPGPPFTFIGIDTFGPWEIVTRKTRGGAANSKRWAMLFTCLVSRALHIEIVEEMSSSSIINALHRFLALRRPVKLIRSDRGTNFIGASEEMKIDTIKVENGPVHIWNYMEIQCSTCIPHGRCMGENDRDDLENFEFYVTGIVFQNPYA